MNTWTILLIAIALLPMILTRIGKTSPKQAKELVKAGAKLIDVRSPSEFASGHIPGAVNVPVQDLPARLKDAGRKDAPVVIYCRSGARSGRAASILKSAGYTKVYDLGAMSRW